VVRATVHIGVAGVDMNCQMAPTKT